MSTPPKGTLLQLQITEKFKFEDLDFLDEIELDQNKVVAGKNPSEHVSVGQEYSPDSETFDLLQFEIEQSNKFEEPNANASKVELNQNMVVTEKHPVEHVSIGQEYPPDSTQPFDLLQFEIDQSNSLTKPYAESKVELNQNIVATGNNPIGQEYPPDSAQPFDLSEFIKIDQSNNLNGANAAPNVEPNTESFASLTLSDSDLNVSSRGFPPVHDQITDTNLFVENSDSNSVYQIQTATEIQPIITQNYNEPTEMNFANFYNPQSYVQPNNFVQQPGPSTYPELKFLQISDNNVLVLCKKEDLAATQHFATNSLVGTASLNAPILHQTQGPDYIINPMAMQSNPGLPNVPANCNLLQSMPRFFMAPPNRPTQRMGFNGPNPPIAFKPGATYQKIVPGVHFNPTDCKPLYNFRLQARNASEAAAKQTAELSLTTSKKEVSDELLEFNEKKAPHKSCSCEKSNCLKLYCECLVSSVLCQESCKCCNCFNNVEHIYERSEVVQSILERNPTAFARKIDKSGSEHKIGCKCKRSNCLKNYCECYTANIPCSGNCKCRDCKNTSTEDELYEDEPMEIPDDVPKPNEENTSNSSNSDCQKEKKKPVELFDLLSDNVMNGVYDCMLWKAAKCPGNEDDKMSAAMDEFSSRFNDIRAAYDIITANHYENGKKVKNIKKKFKKD